MADDFRPRENDRMVGGESRDYDVPSVRGNGAKRVMIGLVAIAAVLGFCVVVLYAYNKGKQDARGNSPPVIQAREGPSKVKPESPGGMTVPNRDKEIFTRLEAVGKPQQKEQLLPPPEKPLAPPKGVEAVKSKPAMIAPAAGGDTATKVPELRPPPPPAQKGNIKPPQVVKKAPQKQVAVSKPAMKVAPASTGGRYRVQISSLRSETSVRRSWSTISARNKDILGNLSLLIERTQVAEKGTFYRMQAGRLQTRAQAGAVCSRLKQRKVSCIVVRR